jgi:hypothetical protein
MATTHIIALHDWVELLEPVDAAPVGARGGVLEFHDNGDVAMLEIMEPDLEGLDRIVVAPLSKLKRIEPPRRR